MKKRILNRRGVALEMAIIMMLEVFALTTIMITLCLYSRNSVEKQTEKACENLEVDMVGERFYAAVKEDSLLEFSPGNENVTYFVQPVNCGSGSMEYTLRASVTGKDGQVRHLVVTVRKNNQSAQILRWTNY